MSMPPSLPPTPNTQVTPMTYKINAFNHAMIGGVDVVKLAEQYGTPLYILDESTVRAMAGAYREGLRKSYPGESLVLFAAKANLNLGLCKLIQQEELGIDVVSGGELYTALQAGFPPEKIFFNGNNKTLEELELAIHHHVGRIIADNFRELELIHKIASQKQVQVNVLLRVTPGIECHTHDYIKTGQIDSKFGFDLSALSQAIDLIMNPYKETIALKGLHAHIGSQIFETKVHEDLTEVLLNIYFNIRKAYDGLVLTDLNLGGGLGIAYTKKDAPPDVSKIMLRLGEKVKSYAEYLEYPLPRLLVEPGRSLVATAGATLYTVGSTKEIPQLKKKYIAVDGGMGDNIRPALYQAQYSALIANKADKLAHETVTVAGKFCESGDILIEQLTVPKVDAGDLLLVFGTGAYNYSMSSNYNRIPRPAMVLVNGGKSYTLVRRETYDDVIRQDAVPEHLIPGSSPGSSKVEKSEKQETASTKTVGKIPVSVATSL